ncbi:MAG: hypothetical protein D6B25_00025 [Desulfobulbaceae bacterium]|nr:MAG: hypothetical protein D6B25_00025 [Desulfobulbaceae bacterium]
MQKQSDIRKATRLRWLLGKIGLAISDDPGSAAPQSCPDSNELAALVENKVSKRERRTLLDHLSTCDECYQEWLILCEVARDGEQKSGRLIKIARYFSDHKVISATGTVAVAAASVMVFLTIPMQNRQAFHIQEDVSDEPVILLEMDSSPAPASPPETAEGEGVKDAETSVQNQPVMLDSPLAGSGAEDAVGRDFNYPATEEAEEEYTEANVVAVQKQTPEKEIEVAPRTRVVGKLKPAQEQLVDQTAGGHSETIAHAQFSEGKLQEEKVKRLEALQKQEEMKEQHIAALKARSLVEEARRQVLPLRSQAPSFYIEKPIDLLSEIKTVCLDDQLEPEEREALLEITETIGADPDTYLDQIELAERLQAIIVEPAEDANQQEEIPTCQAIMTMVKAYKDEQSETAQ